MAAWYENTTAAVERLSAATGDKAAKVNDVIEAATTAILQRLRAKYALETDVSLGPRKESRSQIAASIDKMLSGSAADRRVKAGRLYRTGGWER